MIIHFLLSVAILQGNWPPPCRPELPIGGIDGITMRSDADEPLPFVKLTFIPLDPQPSSGRSSSASRSFQVTSNPMGDFRRLLPTGRYFIVADREYYVHREFFRTGPDMPPEAKSLIIVCGGAQSVRLAMDPNPSIIGKVYGPLGQPLPAATVQAYQLRYTPYGRELHLAATELAQENGQYRLFRLDPGYYFVSASFSRAALQPWRSVLEFSPNLSNPDDGYSTIYYSGALRSENAKPVNLLGVREAANVDIVLKDSRYFKLKVKLLLPQSTARPMLNPRVAILPTGSDLGIAANYPAIGRDANYSQDRLLEGDYVLVALADFIDADDKTSTAVISDTVPVRLSEDTEIPITAMYPLDLLGRLTSQPNSSIPRGLRVRLVRVDRNAQQTVAVDVDTTGSFNLLDVGPGTYDVYLSGTPRNSFLQDVRLSNADRQFGQIRIDGKQPERFLEEATGRWQSILPLNVVMNLQSGNAVGRVMDAAGQPFLEATVVLVPASAAARLRTDRYFKVIAHTGEFQIPEVPPGRYIAYAFQRLEQDYYFDPDFNARIASRGVTVDIAAGPGRQMDLIVVTTDALAKLLQ